MTIDTAKQLRVGDKITHNGEWAYRVGEPRTYEVLTTDSDCIRVQMRGRVSLYEWGGCSLFVTRDFFASCKLSS